MIDHNVVATENWIAEQESAAEYACLICAVEVNGLTIEQAERCDRGHWNCHGCPFGGSEHVQDAFANTKNHEK